MKDVHSSKNVHVLSPLRADTADGKHNDGLSHSYSRYNSQYTQIVTASADDDTFSDNSVLTTIPTPPPVLPLLQHDKFVPIRHHLTNTGGTMSVPSHVSNTHDVIHVVTIERHF